MERNKLTTQQNQFSKKPTGVFYIDGNKSFYFELSLSSPIKLDIPTDIIANFELLNKKKLNILISSFIKNNNLIPNNIVILLSPHVTFDKDFPHGSIEVQKNIQEFLELVPFEDTLDKKIIVSGKTRVVATNKELCDAIKQDFTSSGFLVSGIYPLSQVSESVPQLKSNLDLSLFVNKVSDLKAYNLRPIVEAAYHHSSTPEKDKPNKTRLYLLAGVFVFLMLILGYAVYTNVIASSDKEEIITLPTPTLAPVTPIPVVQEVSLESPKEEVATDAANL